MFSYVDEKIRTRLLNDKRWVIINKDGELMDVENGDAPYISLLGPIPIPRYVRGKEIIINWYPFVRRVEMKRVQASAAKVREGRQEAFRELIQNNISVSSVLAVPGFLEKSCPLVRIHSCCLTGEVFGSTRCDCGPQLETAFEKIVDEGGGAVVYMSSHEGRGIGLWAKAVTYLLQDEGQDTYQANVSLGLPEDSRDFTDAATVLRYLIKGKPIRLLSNNPEKKAQLEQGGQEVTEIVPLNVGFSRHNLRYMESKREKGHLLHDLDAHKSD